MSLTFTPILVLGCLLGASVLGNAFLANRWISAREEVATVTQEKEHYSNAALECNASIGELQDQADARAIKALPLLADAKAKAMTLEQRAQATLAAPATAPGDDCKSAQGRADAWLQSRGARP